MWAGEDSVESNLRKSMVFCYVGSVISLGLAANAALGGATAEGPFLDRLVDFGLPSVWGLWGGIWMTVVAGKLEVSIKRYERRIDFHSISAGSAAFSDAVEGGDFLPNLTPKAMAKSESSRKQFEDYVWEEAATDQTSKVTKLELCSLFAAPVIGLMVPLLANLTGQ